MEYSCDFQRIFDVSREGRLSKVLQTKVAVTYGLPQNCFHSQTLQMSVLLGQDLYLLFCLELHPKVESENEKLFDTRMQG